MDTNPATIRFTVERRQELKVLAAQRGITMEAALEEAFDMWAAGAGNLSNVCHLDKIASLARRIEADGDRRRMDAALCILEALAGAL